MSKLSEVAIFCGLSQDEIDQLLAQSTRRTFAKGDFVVEQGEKGHSMFVIEEGTVEICVDQKGSRLVVNTIEACTVVGEKAFIDAQTRAASVIACTPVKAREMSWPEFSRLLDNGSPLAGKLLYNVAKLMAQRMKILLEKFASLNSSNINSREMEQFRNKVFTEWNF